MYNSLYYIKRATWQNNNYEAKSPVTVADATFTSRIPKDSKHFFTKKGPNKLEVVSTTGTQVPKCSQQPLFPKWKEMGNWPTLTQPPKRRGAEYRYHLQLTLRPNTLNHKDEWTVVSLFNWCVYCSNSAAEGYGGLNVYARIQFKVRCSLMHRQAGHLQSDKKWLKG